jgi:hypothetical protein
MIPVRLIGCALAAVALCRLLPLEGTIWSGILGGLLYLALILVTGTLSVRHVRGVLSEIVASRLAQAAPPVRGGP